MKRRHKIFWYVTCGFLSSWLAAYLCLGLSLKIYLGSTTRQDAFDTTNLPVALAVLDGGGNAVPRTWRGYSNGPPLRRLRFKSYMSPGVLQRSWSRHSRRGEMIQYPISPAWSPLNSAGFWWSVPLEPQHAWGSLSRIETGDRIMQTGYPVAGVDHAYGVPFLCLTYDKVVVPAPAGSTYEVSGGVTLHDPPYPDIPIVLPFRVMWRGMLANIVFFALVIWLIRRGGRAVLSYRRLKRGRCPRCAYDLAHNYRSGCPECGWRRLLSQPSTDEPRP